MINFNRITPNGMYRSRNGVLLGVCRGISEYYDFSIFWVRAIMLTLLIFTGFWPFGVLYVIAALLMKPKPVIPLVTDDEREFYDSYVHSRTGATGRLKRRYENIEKRIRRMEDIVTSREFDFERRLNS